MKTTLLILVIACLAQNTFGQAGNEQLLAKVYANTRYFYPAKNIRKADWDHLLLNGLGASKAPQVAFTDSLTAIFAKADIHIKLHKERPAVLKPVSVADNKGKYWSYYGFGDTQTKLILGPFLGFIYKWIIHYDKKLKPVDDGYVNRLAGQENIALTDNSLLVKVDDWWLEMPLNPHKASTRKITPTQTFTDFKLHTKVGAIQYWAAVYLFYPYPINQTWEAILAQALQRAEDGVPSKSVFRYIASTLNDAHAMIWTRQYPRPLVTNDIDGSLYVRGYHPQYFDSTILGARVLTINGTDADSALAALASLISSSNPDYKNAQASWLLLHEYKDSILTITIEYAHGGLDTLELPIVGPYNFVPAPKVPEEQLKEHGISYFNIYYTKGKRIIEAIQSPECKGLIIDMRYDGVVDAKFLSYLADSAFVWMDGHMQCNDYPERMLTTFDTIADDKPTQSATGQKPNKPIVFLCGPISVSYRESMLGIVKQNNLGTIIGSPTAGITGEVVALPIWDGQHHGAARFTGVVVVDFDGTIFDGLEPDILVKPTVQGLITNTDEVLQRAVDYVIENQRR